MDRPRRCFARPALPALSALALALGCAGPPISSPIEGIPVCPDFTTGNVKMEGSLRFPVRLRVLDGKTVLYRTIISGLREAGAPMPHSYIADDNANHRVEWAQCANPRAPRSATEQPRGHKAMEKARDTESSAYECGEATVYKPDGVLALKKGDRASHVITFVAPPNPECWTGDVVALAAQADAGAPVEPGDAGVAAGDAGPAPATDAGTADAGAAGAGAADAGTAPATPADAGAAKPKP